MISRVQTGSITRWWWTIDKSLLLLSLILLIVGVILSFAASPSVAMHIGRLDSYAFVKQHMSFAFIALILMLFISFFDETQLRNLYIGLAILSFILLIAVLFIGVETKGSVRWLRIFGLTIEPSEILKPSFIVLTGWLFSLAIENNLKIAKWWSFLIYAACLMLLLKEPDVGQAVLITIIWSVMLFLANISVAYILAFIGGLSGLFYIVYLYSYHVHIRVQKFLTGLGDTFQVDMGREAILHGGWFGVGPGEGTIKRIIPDSHTDFVFSVAAEEYGIIVCIFISLAFAFIVMRATLRVKYEDNYFIKLSVMGLATQLGVQSFINIGVNLHLLPAKGMTLPFISYGGSSMMSIALVLGALLSLTRKKTSLGLESRLKI